MSYSVNTRLLEHILGNVRHGSVLSYSVAMQVRQWPCSSENQFHPVSSFTLPARHAGQESQTMAELQTQRIGDGEAGPLHNREERASAFQSSSYMAANEQNAIQNSLSPWKKVRKVYLHVNLYKRNALSKNIAKKHFYLVSVDVGLKDC